MIKKVSKIILITFLIIMISSYVYAKTELIVNHPESVIVKEGEKVEFNVLANGEDLEFIWLYKTPEYGFTWKEVTKLIGTVEKNIDSEDATSVTSTLIIDEAKAEYAGYAFKCLVKEKNANVATLTNASAEPLITASAEILMPTNANTQTNANTETLTTVNAENLNVSNVESLNGVSIETDADLNAITDSQSQEECTQISNTAYLYVKRESIAKEVMLSEIADPSNLKAVGSSDGKMTLTFENPNEKNKIILEVLNEENEWEIISADIKSPFIIEGLKENTNYDYRIHAEDITGIKSKYLYDTGYMPYILTNKVIIKQPETIVVKEGEKAEIKVETSGENLKHIWLYKTSKEEYTWQEVDEKIGIVSETKQASQTVSTLTINNIKEEYMGYAFKCLVEENVTSNGANTSEIGASITNSGDQNGITLGNITTKLVKEISNTAYLYVKRESIAKEVMLSEIADPSNLKAVGSSDGKMTLTFENPNENNKIILEVLNEENEWKIISADIKSPFIIEGLKENTNYDYRIHAEDITGIKSKYLYDTGYMPYILTNKVIIKQPETIVVKEGEKAEIKVETSGENLKHTWLYKTSKEEYTWQEVDEKIGVVSETKQANQTVSILTINNIKEEYMGYAFKCLVEENVTSSGANEIGASITNSGDQNGITLGNITTKLVKEISNTAYLYVKRESIAKEVMLSEIADPSNLKAVGSSDGKMTLTFENPNENNKIILEVLNEENEWKIISADIKSPFIIEGLKENTNCDYRIHAEDITGIKSKYLYDTGYMPYILTNKVIIKQPETIVVKEGEKAEIKVETSGENLKHTWLYKTSKEEYTWQEVDEKIGVVSETKQANQTVSTLTIDNIKEEYMGYAFKCLVEENVTSNGANTSEIGASITNSGDQNGITLGNITTKLVKEISNTAYLYVKQESIAKEVMLSEIADPSNLKAVGSSDGKMTLTFENPNENNKIILEVLNEENEWEIISADIKSPFIIEGLKENTNYDYRIHAEDITGIKSKYLYDTGYMPYILTNKVIIKQPETIVVKEGEKAEIKVETSGEKLKHTWLYKTSKEEYTWQEVDEKIGVVSETKQANQTVSTLTIDNIKEEYMGYAFKCLVEENVTSSGANEIGASITNSGDQNGITLGKITTKLVKEISNTAYLYVKRENLMLDFIVEPVAYFYEDGRPYDSEWTNQNVIAILPIIDEKTSGVAVKGEGGEWSTNPTYANIENNSAEVKIVFNKSMNTNIYIRRIDADGYAMKEDDHKLIKIDKENPLIEEFYLENKENGMTLIAKVSDKVSGVEYYSITKDEEEPTKWENYEQENDIIEKQIQTSGKYNLFIMDKAGNITSGDIDAIMDVTPPKGSIDIESTNIASGEKYTNKDIVTVKINATDNYTPTERIMFALYSEEEYKEIKSGKKDIEWRQYVESVQFTLKQEDGINIIYAIFKDEAGNISMSQKFLKDD